MIIKIEILFLGYSSGTSAHRLNAFKRLGHNITHINPWRYFAANSFLVNMVYKLKYYIGAGWIEHQIFYKLSSELRGKSYDLIWNDQNELIGPRTSKMLKKHTQFMVAHSNDDPFGKRDKQRFSLYRQAIQYYDLIVVCRTPNISEAYALGAMDVHRIYLSADEIVHKPQLLSVEEKEKWASDVVFVGTWMPERGPFLKRLIELGVPLSIYGNRWRKAPEWDVLKRVWRGPGLVDTDYVRAIQSAKICLGLLSKGNRDLHTRRSTEIPYIGSVLCAERTIEHLAMYKEGVEAVFWNSPEGCAEKCFSLLENDAKRKAIAKAGHKRCLQNGYLNENVLGQIIERVFEK